MAKLRRYMKGWYKYRGFNIWKQDNERFPWLVRDVRGRLEGTTFRQRRDAVAWIDTYVDGGKHDTP